MSKGEPVREGRYLYCLADGRHETSFGPVGLEGSEVYTIPYRELCAVVHNCPAEPYKSNDDEIVKEWIVTHQKVVEVAWKQFGTVLPAGFDTIISGDTSTPPDENLRRWLREDYPFLQEGFTRVRGRAEYGVQIFWDTTIIMQQIVQERQDLWELEEKIKTQQKGTAYLHRQKLERLIRDELEVRADQNFREFFHRIKRHVHDLRVEKLKDLNEDRQMVMNLACLIDKDRYAVFGEELEHIHAIEGLSVRFTGPWPPYSFVAPG